ncbi:MAG TPA: MG2 domain-containing protein [Saprospiraceae bacterium]|nr:MG2 domain-containing protein [Saprospiraceae bacterium]
MKFIFISLFLTSLIASITYQNQTNKMQNTDPLNSIDFPDYKKLWLEIDSLESNGLFQEALEKCKYIYQLATTDYNYPQIYKSFLLQLKFANATSDQFENKLHQTFLNEYQQQQEPVKSLLASVLSDYYSGKIRYTRYDRTDIDGEEQDENDVLSWSQGKLIQLSNEYALKSIQYEGLKNIQLKDYKEILDLGTDSLYRPTLFDLLLHKSINHFKGHYSELTEFEEFVEIHQAVLPLSEFLNYKFTQDSGNSSQLAILFQKGLQFHQKNNNLEALHDLNLLRLDYFYSRSNTDLKKSNYLDDLNLLLINENNSIRKSDIQYYIIQLHNSEVDNKNPEFKTSRKEIHTLCKEFLKNYPNQRFSPNVQQIVSSLESKTCSIEIEQVYLPKKAILYKLNYTNLSGLNAFLFKINENNNLNIFALRKYQLINNVKSYELIKKFKETWPSSADFQGHSVELKLDPLEIGNYLIVLTEKEHIEQFSDQDINASFTVSQLSCIIPRVAGQKNKILALDRMTGEPLKSVLIKGINQEYNRHGHDQFSEIPIGKTDQNGLIELKQNFNGILRLQKGNDILFTDYTYLSDEKYSNHHHEKIELFTDRGIYRPGQTVYFKGIKVNYNQTNMPLISTSKKVTISMLDVNGQQIHTENYSLNQYGTFSGSFILPKSCLNGEFTFTSNTNYLKSIRVEEYKRPKFEIVWDTVQTAYKKGDLVSIHAVAQSFSGVPLDQGKLSYRILKRKYIPYWPCWFSFYSRTIPSSEEQIASGKQTLNADGSFTVQFRSTPEQKDDVDDLAYDIYTLVADVLDLSGETQSSTHSIQIGQNKISISSNLNFEMPLSKDQAIELQLSNMDAKGISATVSYELISLDQPTKVFKKRYWTVPDQWKFTQKEYDSYFPDYSYKNEDLPSNWKKNKTILKSEKMIHHKGELFTFKSLPPGAYQLILEAYDGSELLGESIEYFKLISEEQLNVNPFASIPKKSAQPGELIKTFISNKKKYHYYSIIESINDSGFELIDKNSPFVKGFTILEKHRAGVNLNVACVYNNRIYNFDQTISVPFTNKELEIITESFRDKMLPGEEEEFRIKIQSKNGKPLSAEVLASMYDMSLDQLAANDWEMSLYPELESTSEISGHNFGYTSSYGFIKNQTEFPVFHFKYSDFLNFANYNMGAELNELTVRMAGSKMPSSAAPMEKSMAQGDYAAKEKKETEDSLEEENKTESKSTNLPLRSNFNETVFFYPHLISNQDGILRIKYKMGDALTKWKLQLFANSLDLSYGFKTLEIITSKPIQLFPNYPRFIRQSDELFVNCKISNTSSQKEMGRIQFEILDANTLENITQELNISETGQQFELNSNESKAYQWNLKIPADETRSYVFRFIAKGSHHQDAEENFVPVLTNKMLVTETKAIAIKGNSRNQIEFEAVKKLNQRSSTHKPHSLTVESTSHPVWYAVQSLPYLADYPHLCAEQLSSKLYANAVGAMILNQYPKIKNALQRLDISNQIQSPLNKNQELKSALLEETPWLMDAKDESKQMQSWKMLLDFNKMSQEKDDIIGRLSSMQNADGGFPWFTGGPSDWFITQQILLNIAQLKHLEALDINQPKIQTLIYNAGNYIDSKLIEDYHELEKLVNSGKTTLDQEHISYIHLHYLYIQSMLKRKNTNEELKKIIPYYLGQCSKYWYKNNPYWEGLCALSLNALTNDSKTISLIVKSLKQRAIQNEELGMYWKENWSCFWYHQPIETQALMIEVFHQIAKDVNSVDAMKTWLLKNKQTNHWPTTKSTTAAIYALLSTGSKWENELNPMTITIGQTELKQAASEVLGYAKTSFDAKSLTASMSSIQIKNENRSIAWAGAYYQYFEQLDKIQFSQESSLKLNKEYYKKIVKEKKQELISLKSGESLNVGDVLTVRMIIKSDREMEYIHLKDMRPAACEPTHQLSAYEWNSGLSYYKSPGDLATHFFISRLPKGTYVLEYDLRVTQHGQFSTGISSIQSMYAPEFAAHSEGKRISVAK